jgi:hypothetical protein
MNCVAMFRTEYSNAKSEDLSGRQTQVTIPGNVDAIHSMILNDQRIFTKMISETLVISQERVGYIIHEILDMIKLTAK